MQSYALLKSAWSGKPPAEAETQTNVVGTRHRAPDVLSVPIRYRTRRESQPASTESSMTMFQKIILGIQAFKRAKAEEAYRAYRAGRSDQPRPWPLDESETENSAQTSEPSSAWQRATRALTGLF
jgi:hypothetical protein